MASLGLGGCGDGGYIWSAWQLLLSCVLCEGSQGECSFLGQRSACGMGLSVLLLTPLDSLPLQPQQPPQQQGQQQPPPQQQGQQLLPPTKDSLPLPQQQQQQQHLLPSAENSLCRLSQQKQQQPPVMQQEPTSLLLQQRERQQQHQQQQQQEQHPPQHSSHSSKGPTQAPLLLVALPQAPPGPLLSSQSRLEGVASPKRHP